MRPWAGFLGRRLLPRLVGQVIATAQAISPPEIDEPPPFWGRWSRIYWLVAGLFAAEVVVFCLLGWWSS